MSRALPYRIKPPSGWAEMVEEVTNSTLYLVQETGPTSFILKDSNQTKYKVNVGGEQVCSCKSKDLCVHILFVMLKVLRVQPSSPVAWQKALIDPEINDILSRRYSRAAPLNSDAIRPANSNNNSGDTSASGGSEGSGKASGAGSYSSSIVEQRPIEDCCPICQDDMTEEEALSYCKKGCGNTVHSRCMKVWAEHRMSIKEDVTCPMCRKDWGPLALNEIKKEIHETKKPGEVHYNRTCTVCRVTPIRGTIYRCLFCRNVDMCDVCFCRGQSHVHHPFVKRESTVLVGGGTNRWEPGERPLGSNGPYGQPRRPLANENQIDYSALLQSLASQHNTNDTLTRYLLMCLDHCNIFPGSHNVTLTCGYCNEMFGVTTALRKLPCSHIMHEKCLLKAFIQNRFNCPLDSQCIFPGLRSNKKKPQLSTTSEPEERKENANTTAVISLGGLELNGIGFVTNNTTTTGGTPTQPSSIGTGAGNSTQNNNNNTPERRGVIRRGRRSLLERPHPTGVDLNTVASELVTLSLVGEGTGHGNFPIERIPESSSRVTDSSASNHGRNMRGSRGAEGSSRPSRASSPGGRGSGSDAMDVGSCDYIISDSDRSVLALGSVDSRSNVTNNVSRYNRNGEEGSGRRRGKIITRPPRLAAAPPSNNSEELEIENLEILSTVYSANSLRRPDNSGTTSPAAGALPNSSNNNSADERSAGTLEEPCDESVRAANRHFLYDVSGNSKPASEAELIGNNSNRHQHRSQHPVHGRPPRVTPHMHGHVESDGRYHAGSTASSTASSTPVAAPPASGSAVPDELDALILSTSNTSNRHSNSCYTSGNSGMGSGQGRDDGEPVSEVYSQAIRNREAALKLNRIREERMLHASAVKAERDLRAEVEAKEMEAIRENRLSNLAKQKLLKKRTRPQLGEERFPSSNNGFNLGLQVTSNRIE